MRLIQTALLMIATLATPLGAIAAPQISVVQPIYDFGFISQGKKVEHVFVVRNRGNAPLTIRSVRPSCGCTAAAPSASVIAPGAKGEIKATFNSANYAGDIRKTVTVESSDPKNPTSVLTLKGTVVEEVQLAPRQLNLGQVRFGATTRSSVTVTNRGRSPLRLTAVTSTLPQVAVTVDKKRLRPGESGTLLVSVTPRKGDRLLSGYIRVTTDNPDKPELSVPVYGSPTN